MATGHLTALLSDREAFGHWLSGFTDGEGNFHLVRHGKRLKNGPSSGFQASFRLSVRVDDQEIIKAIRDYFGCGNIYPWTNNRGHPNDKPQVKFQIASAPVLMRAVVPHFDAYPLRAKKARDYVIWREAVEYINRVQQRPRRGNAARWNSDDIAVMVDLKERLSAERAFSLVRPTLLSVSVPEVLES